MDYQNSQQAWLNDLGLSSEYLDKIQQQLPPAKYLDFVSNSFGYMPLVNSSDFMLKSYNSIKDDSWPECSSIGDLKNLPQHIIDECRDVHGFDFLIYDADNISVDRWNKFNSGVYPVSELVRYKNVVLDLQQYFKDKKIFDFACHAGMISLLALHVGAKFVTASNVRPEFVKLAEKMLSLSGHTNFDTTVADIHDYYNNQKICQGNDVVLLYGIMYHVHDHCQILESVAKAAPPTIIIDTHIHNNIIDIDEPLMYWLIEDSDVAWNGWVNGTKDVVVGAPNIKWFELFMSTQNYKLVHSKKYFCQGVGFFDSPKDQRAVMVFEKNS